MKIGKMRSVKVGARGTGAGSDNVTFTVGEIATLETGSQGMVEEIRVWHGEYTGINVDVIKEGGILFFKAVDQPLTIEYEDPE